MQILCKAPRATAFVGCCLNAYCIVIIVWFQVESVKVECLQQRLLPFSRQMQHARDRGDTPRIRLRNDHDNKPKVGCDDTSRYDELWARIKFIYSA